LNQLLVLLWYNDTMSCWSFVKALILFVALLALLTVACGQKDGLRSEIINSIDKMSSVESFRSTTNKVTITDSYVQSYSATVESAGRCSNHSYEIIVENRVGNGTTEPFGKNWYLEPGTPTSWQESILIGSTGYWRSSEHPSWGLVLVECMGGYTPLYSELYLYRFLGSIEELTTENIGNVSCRHYKGNVDYDAYVDRQIEETKKLQENPVLLIEDERIASWIEEIEKTRQNENEAVAEFWVDEEGYIRQLKTEKRSLNVPTDTQDEWTTEVTVIRYSDFNQSITIEPPPAPPITGPTPTPTPSPP